MMTMINMTPFLVICLRIEVWELPTKRKAPEGASLNDQL
jgi:hypothetical protein